jgi:hypothetical protein
VIIAYDDSYGWYDHQMGRIVNQSQDPSQDLLAATDLCGTQAVGPVGFNRLFLDPATGEPVAHF